MNVSTRVLQRESVAAARIPYTAHVADRVVRTVDGHYVQVLRLAGVSFECADDEELNNWHERLNITWRNVASPQVALWAHVVRRRERAVVAGNTRQGGFAEELAVKYRRRLFGQTLMVNDVYLSAVYRPVAGVASGFAAKLLGRGGGEAMDLPDALDNCEKLGQVLCASLERYEPQRLGLYSHGRREYSQLLEFLGLLVNGEWRAVPLPRAPINEVLATSRMLFGSEVIEYRLPTETRLGAVLGIKEYPTPSVVGMFNALLSAPFPFVLTQSFAFLTKAAGQGLLQRQHARMVNAGDFAVSQALELKQALDALTSNDFVMGDHHFSLQVFSDGPDVKRLNDAIALARAMVADAGIAVAREDLALEGAYWAQLPGNFRDRPRRSPITSRNFAAMSAFHNYPTGRRSGNHWGEALALLVTSARSPYYFSLHASDPRDAGGGSRKDTGHTLICGPTGSGKTVFIGFLVTMLSRQGVSQVIFDKDRGLEILVRALGGEYLALKTGAPTGFNPLRLPLRSANFEFLKVWLRSLLPGQPLTTSEESDLDQALRGVLALHPGARRLSRLIEYTDPTQPEGLYARLAPWCEGAMGDYAWVFDNAEDSVTRLLSAEPSVIGFDVTEFLDHERLRAPVTLYLFHLVRQLLDGRRMVCWMDEFWRLVADPAFENFAKDGPKTWRKLNGVMAMATQSASDVLQSSISRTLVEQTPTKIFFPNGDAVEEEYVGGFGLTEREFKLIKEQLTPGSRMFLVKQGHDSVVCRLDLKGFDGELKVISGRASSVMLMHRLLTEVGEEPERWLPRFLADI